MSVLRLAQFLLAVCMAVHLLLIAATNITDYGVNFEFLRQVTGMADTFSVQKTWRSLRHPVLLHLLYWIIIAAEAGGGWLCSRGVRRMWNSRNAPDRIFDAGKRDAARGALLGLSLWFGGFIVVGGEWFLMWQSKSWNALPTAYGLAAIYGLALLVFLKQERAD